MKLERTRDQWEKCDPEVMSKMYQSAIYFALRDAKHDILALHAELARAASPAAPAQSGEAVAEVIKWRTFTGHTAWDFKVFDKTLEHGAKLYAAPQPSPTAVVPYRAASDCQYVGASEEAKCAWADGWNQCAQFTKGSHDGY